MNVTLPDGIRLWCARSGHGKPLMLLHGLGGCGGDWAMQLPALNRHFHVIRPDLRGHGRSSHPAGGYTIKQMADDCAALLKRLALPRVHLAGISLGGMVALQLALDFPQLVDRLALINSTPALTPQTFGQRLELWARLAAAHHLSMRWTGFLLSWRLFPAREQRLLRKLFLQRWSHCNAHSYHATLRGLAGWTVLERLPQLQAPLLVISGDHDFFPLSAKQLCAERAPRGRLVTIANSRHASIIDQPEACTRILLDFFGGNS